MEEIKIISITKKARSKKYQVETNEDSYTFLEDTIIKYMIFKDACFSKTKWNEILEQAKEDEYFNKTLNYLGSSYKSKYEIETYLNNKSNKTLSDEQIDNIIKRIENLGYINDSALATYYLDYYYRNNKGPLYIKNKLKQKKIDEQCIKNVLNHYTNEMEVEVINKILAKEKNNKYPLKKFKLLLSNKLVQNGFSSTIVYSLIENYDFEDISDEIIMKDYNKAFAKALKKDPKEQKQIIINYLMNKGYDYRTINNFLSEIKNNN